MQIVVLTPARNEADTIENLYKSLISTKSATITWYIIENGSTDNTLEVCKKFDPKEHLEIVIKSINTIQNYSVGEALSNILADALNTIKKEQSNKKIDYLCLFDADVSFDENYINSLRSAFSNDPQLKLTSGLGYNGTKFDNEGIDHVRGNARMWDWKYISNKGIPRGPSWDSISKFEVYLDGYSAYPIQAVYQCRPMGAKQSDFNFYGHAAYYRGVGLTFIFFKAAKMALINEPYLSYLRGYLLNALVYKNKSKNANLRKYVRDYSNKKVLNWLKKFLL